VKQRKLLSFWAIFMLFIIGLSNIGLPVISHQCNYSKKKSVHLFSYEHQCKKASCSLSDTQIPLDVHFEKVPCCSIETQFLQAEDHLTSTADYSFKSNNILSYFSPIATYISPKKSTFKPFHPIPIAQRQYGLPYRIFIQSFII
jgi:hypothetical protein